MEIEYKTLGRPFMDGNDISYEEGDTFYFEHKINELDVEDFYLSQENITETKEILGYRRAIATLFYEGFFDNYLEDDDDFKEFIKEKYEDDAMEQYQDEK